MARNRWLLACFTLSVALLSCGRNGFSPSLPVPDFSVNAVDFDVRSGTTGEAQVIAISDENRLNVPWTAVATAPWITISPAMGITPSEMRVSVNDTNLAPGTHLGEIVVTFETERPDGVRPIGSIVVEATVTAPGFQNLGVPSCACTLSVAVDPNDPARIFAGDETYEIFTTLDGGTSFGAANLGATGYVRDIQLQASGRGYAGADGIYRSNDGGLSWNQVGLSGESIHHIAVSPVNDDILLAEGSGLWRSLDGGTTWEDVSMGTNTRFVAPHPGDPNLFVVGGDNGTMFTTTSVAADGLTALTATGTSSETYSFAALNSGRWVVSHTKTDNLLIYSDDQGATWTTSAANGLGPSQHFHYPLLASVGDTLWAMNENIYRSDDGGETFNLVPFSEEPYNTNSRFLQVAETGSELVFAHNGFGLVRYDGASLRPMGLNACTIRSLRMDGGSGDVYGVTYETGPFAYQNQAIAGLAVPADGKDHFRDISVHPSNPGIIAVAVQGGGLSTTTDAGTTWVTGAPGMTSSTAYEVHRAPENSDSLWVTSPQSGQGLYRSADSVTFELVALGYIYHAAPISTDVAVFQRSKDIVRYDHSSGTETVIEADIESIRDITRTEDGSIWVLADSGAWRSTDDGLSFTNLGLGGATFRGVATDAGDSNHVFLATSTALLESVDGGMTWQDTGSPFIPHSVTTGPAGSIYMGTQYGGLYRFTTP